jgi:ABC-2 type transport system permease protein
MAGHIVIAAVGGTALLAAMGLASAVAHAAVVGDLPGQVASLVPSALLRVPAALVVGGLTVAFFGRWPRVATGLSWGAYAVFVVLTMFGTLLDLPQLVVDLSPFTHVSTTPGGTVPPAPLAWLAAVTVALAASGMLWFRRRDLALS